MSGTRATTAFRRRAPVPAALLGLVLLAAACGSHGTATPGGGPAPTAGQPLAPWSGTLTAVALPAGIQSLRSVSCPTATRCWAVGSASPTGAAVVTTTDGGATWSTRAVPTTVGHLTGIACTGPRRCTAVGQVGTTGTGPGAVLATTDGGASWTLEPVPAGTSDVTAVTCSGSTCTALADVAGRVTSLASVGVGAPWVAGGPLPTTVTAGTGLSCVGSGRCWATATAPVDIGHTTGAVVATTDGGSTWTPEQVPPGLGPLRSVACTSGATTPSDGTTRPAGSGVMCTAVGTTATVANGGRSGQGVILTTSNGGVTWVAAPVPAVVADLLSVSCGAGPCVAVGTTVASAPQSGVVVLSAQRSTVGAEWRAAVTATVPLPLAGVDCRTLSSCVAVGESTSVHLAAA